MDIDEAQEMMTASAGSQLPLLVDSFMRLTGERLLDAETNIAAALWQAPCVILAHGTQADPVFFYGNRMALELFEVSASELLAMPSRLSAEAPVREERAQFLQRVTQHGYVADYSGVRISATGRRFRIMQATVWNLIDEAGLVHGQAAAFDQWVRL